MKNANCPPKPGDTQLIGVSSFLLERGNSMKTKIYNTVVGGQSDANIRFADLKNLILALGFIFKGQKCSHAGYYHPSVHARINIQPSKDGKAKPYQVKQLRDIINLYGL